MFLRGFLFAHNLSLLGITTFCYDDFVDSFSHYSSRKHKPKAAEASAPAAPKNLTNLESNGEALKVYSLQNLLKNKRTSKLIPAINLCDVAKKLYEKEVAKPGKSLDGIIDLWLEYVPKELQDGCRLAGFQRGTLNVAVNSATLRAELEGLLRSGLLRTLQSASHGTIFRIKTSVQSTIQEIS